jgi:hypothetical protein
MAGKLVALQCKIGPWAASRWVIVEQTDGFFQPLQAPLQVGVWMVDDGVVTYSR